MSRKRSRRADRRERRTASGPVQTRDQARRLFTPTDILDEEQLDAVHEASLAILRDTGVHFLGAHARRFLAAQHGTTVDEVTGIVRFDPGVVEAAIDTAPASFRLHARNPERSVTVGDGRP